MRELCARCWDLSVELVELPSPDPVGPLGEAGPRWPRSPRGCEFGSPLGQKVRDLVTRDPGVARGKDEVDTVRGPADGILDALSQDPVTLGIPILINNRQRALGVEDNGDVPRGVGRKGATQELDHHPDGKKLPQVVRAVAQALVPPQPFLWAENPGPRWPRIGPSRPVGVESESPRWDVVDKSDRRLVPLTLTAPRQKANELTLFGGSRGR